MDGVSSRGSRACDHARKRGLPLSLVILRYFAYVLTAALALALGTYIAFGILVGTGTVYPANQGDTALAETSARLAELGSDDAEAIDAAVPSSFRWAVFSADGAYVAGDVPERAREALHDAAFDGLAVEYGALSATRYEPVRLADGSVCVLTYEYMPQFASKELRDALPNPQNLLLGGFAVLAVLVLVGIAVRAARVLSRKMAPLAEAAHRIEEHDLDFEVGASGVREIDGVLGAMDEMRASLKDSLEAQWKSEQAQREQVAALAHDLKTPLTVVRGNVDLLAESELPDEARACAADAAEGARQMGTYLAALIDASLGDSAPFAPVECPLGPVLARLRAQAEALAACDGIRVAWSEGPGLPEALRMDGALVERAVMNVVANAVEHAPAGSAVEVRVQVERTAAGETGGCEGGGMLAVSVADAGPGFSPEALERGCERFYQGDPARAARGHCGLGLHVAAETAERHGGSLGLANREAAEGGGARVALRLPLG